MGFQNARKKQKVATDSAKFDAVDAKTTAKANVALVAEAGGLRLPSAGKENQNHKSHSVISILRAAFTPVSAHAYSAVLGCGHTTPSECRAVVTEAMLREQARGLDESFKPGSVCPWAIFTEMHESSKQEICVP